MKLGTVRVLARANIKGPNELAVHKSVYHRFSPVHAKDLPVIDKVVAGIEFKGVTCVVPIDIPMSSRANGSIDFSSRNGGSGTPVEVTSEQLQS